MPFGTVKKTTNTEDSSGNKVNYSHGPLYLRSENYLVGNWLIVGNTARFTRHAVCTVFTVSMYANNITLTKLIIAQRTTSISKQ